MCLGSIGGACGTQVNTDKVRKNSTGFGNKALDSNAYFNFSAIKHKVKGKLNSDVVPIYSAISNSLSLEMQAKMKKDLKDIVGRKSTQAVISELNKIGSETEPKDLKQNVLIHMIEQCFKYIDDKKGHSLSFNQLLGVRTIVDKDQNKLNQKVAILKKSILSLPQIDVLGLKHDDAFNCATTLDDIRVAINAKLPPVNQCGVFDDQDRHTKNALAIFDHVKSYVVDEELYVFKEGVKELMKTAPFGGAHGNQFEDAINDASTAAEVIQAINVLLVGLGNNPSISDVINRLELKVFKHKVKEALGKAPFVNVDGDLLDDAAFADINAANTTAEVIAAINVLVPAGSEFALKAQSLEDGFADIQVQHLPLGIVVGQLQQSIQAFETFKDDVKAELRKLPFNKGDANFADINDANTAAAVIAAINVLDAGVLVGLGDNPSISDVINRLELPVIKHKVKEALGKPPFAKAGGDQFEDADFDAINAATTAAEVIAAINGLVPGHLKPQLSDGFVNVSVQNLPLGIVVGQLQQSIQAFETFKTNVKAELRQAPFGKQGEDFNQGGNSLDAARTTADVIEAINVLVPVGSEFALKDENSVAVADLTTAQVLDHLQDSIGSFIIFKNEIVDLLQLVPLNADGDLLDAAAFADINAANTTAELITAINDLVPADSEFALKDEGDVEIANLTVLQVVEQVNLSVGKFLAIQSLQKLKKRDGSEYGLESLDAATTAEKARVAIQDLAINGLEFKDKDAEDLALVNIAKQLQDLVRREAAKQTRANAVLLRFIRKLKIQKAGEQQLAKAIISFQTAIRGLLARKKVERLKKAANETFPTFQRDVIGFLQKPPFVGSNGKLLSDFTDIDNASTTAEVIVAINGLVSSEFEIVNKVVELKAEYTASIQLPDCDTLKPEQFVLFQLQAYVTICANKAAAGQGLASRSIEDPSIEDTTIINLFPHSTPSTDVQKSHQAQTLLLSTPEDDSNLGEKKQSNLLPTPEDDSDLGEKKQSNRRKSVADAVGRGGSAFNLLKIRRKSSTGGGKGTPQNMGTPKGKGSNRKKERVGSGSSPSHRRTPDFNISEALATSQAAAGRSSQKKSQQPLVESEIVFTLQNSLQAEAVSSPTVNERALKLDGEVIVKTKNKIKDLLKKYPFNVKPNDFGQFDEASDEAAVKEAITVLVPGFNFLEEDGVTVDKLTIAHVEKQVQDCVDGKRLLNGLPKVGDDEFIHEHSDEG